MFMNVVKKLKGKDGTSNRRSKKMVVKKSWVILVGTKSYK